MTIFFWRFIGVNWWHFRKSTVLLKVYRWSLSVSKNKRGTRALTLAAAILILKCRIAGCPNSDLWRILYHAGDLPTASPISPGRVRSPSCQPHTRTRCGEDGCGWNQNQRLHSLLQKHTPGANRRDPVRNQYLLRGHLVCPYEYRSCRWDCLKTLRWQQAGTKCVVFPAGNWEISWGTH